MSIHGLNRDGQGFVPETRVGKWSVGLFLVFAAALGVFIVVALAGAGTWEPDFFADLEATIPLLISAATALGSLCVGLVAIGRQGDRSAAVILVTVLSGMVTFFFIGELLSVIEVLPGH